MIRQFITGVALTAAFLIPSAHAVAVDGDPAECVNFARPVIISQGYDPLHLDTDGDGIACEHNPGDPVKTDLYADLRGLEEGDSNPLPSLSGTLSETGPSDVITRHPLRSIGLGMVLAGTGAVLVLVTRRRER